MTVESEDSIWEGSDTPWKKMKASMCLNPKTLEEYEAALQGIPCQWKDLSQTIALRQPAAPNTDATKRVHLLQKPEGGFKCLYACKSCLILMVFKDEKRAHDQWKGDCKCVRPECASCGKKIRRTSMAKHGCNKLKRQEAEETKQAELKKQATDLEECATENPEPIIYLQDPDQPDQLFAFKW